ncbi:hypothetical protein AB0I60_11070 [Actinosynnema sp. NPDC050436]|uniref:hypothetical protein n=1 Tax=Actinosynnema sp. NPDC050436 TaxID=3155659 RepID=UPI0033D68D6C
MASTRASGLGRVAVVAVLLAVCAGAWVAWHAPLPATVVTLPPTGERGRIAGDPMARGLADFGRYPGVDPDVRVFDDVEKLRFLDTAELAAYREERPTSARAVVEDRPDGRVVVVVVRVADPAAARRTAARLDEVQIAFGLQHEEPVPGVPKVASTPPGATGPLTARAHYASDELVVRVQFDGTSPEALAAFGEIVARQAKALPADD